MRYKYVKYQNFYFGFSCNLFAFFLRVNISNYYTMDKRKIINYKQWSTKHYTEIQGSNNLNHSKNRSWTRVLQKGWELLLVTPVVFLHQ